MADDPILDPSSTPPEAGGNIQEMQIEEDLRESYLSYAMSVIISRALPDARDGLKPSQRRILLAMHDLSLTARAKPVKCAKICGDTNGNYHPHGEAIIYPTLVRMAQDFNYRYPLVDGQGNFGSIDGLGAAAMRYTEARMSAFAENMLDDLDKETVDAVPNYDEQRQEAVVLPSLFPNLLCNGAQGIAVGMATSVPPHNLTEICNAVILLIDKPEATLGDLLEKVPGPDFPTGGVICGRKGIIEGYKTGRSILTVRAKTHFEETKSGRTLIVVTEIPYLQQKSRLLQKISEAIKGEKVLGVSDIEDHSDRHGMRIVIELRKDADANVVLNQLFEFTPLQDSFSVILLALVNHRPRTLSLKQLLQEFISHRVHVIRRRTQFLLRKARHRSHVLEGLLVALSSIEEVIHRIRSSKDIPEARQQLMGLEVAAALLQRALGDVAFVAFQALMGARDTYFLSRIQADTILQMQLQRLTALEQDKLFREYQTVQDEIKECERLLADDQHLLAVVRQDTVTLRDKFGDSRRTEITGEVGDFNLEELIAEATMAVTISHAGYIKRLPLTEYRTQGRGGKGVIAGQTKEGDFHDDVFIASTHDYILFFTDHGQCYWLKVYDIPEMARTAQGRSIVNLLNLKPEEKIASHVPVRNFEDGSLFFTTKRGVVKKTALESYSRPKQGGIIGIALEEGDELIATMVTRQGDHVVLATRDGMAIRFDEANVRAMGRNTYGVKGIALEGDDRVIGAVTAAAAGALLTVCENGFGKRTQFEEYRAQNRGGKGLIDIKTSERNGKVVGVAAVQEGDEVMLISQGGMVVRIPVTEVSVIGRNTQGVRVMRIDDQDRVVALAKIARDDVAEPPAEPPTPADSTMPG